MAVPRRTRPKGRYIVPTQAFSFQTQKRLPISQAREEEASAVILTAQQVEYDAIFNHLDRESIKSDQYKRQGYIKGEFSSNGSSWDVAVAKIGPRIEKAIVVAGQAIDYFEPKIILFVGTAGGINREVLKYGHVVVAEKAYDVESGSESPKFSPVLRKERSNDRVIKIAKNCIGRQDWKKRIEEEIYKNEPEAHLGAVATTKITVKSRNSPIFRRIVKYCGDKVLALEREGFGFLFVANQEDTCAIIIRGVSDFCDHKQKAEKAGSKKCAMINASAFAFELLANIS